MQVIAEVNVIVIREDGPGKYSILLCNPDGSAWIIPFGDVIDIETEDEILVDSDDVFTISGLHYLEIATGLTDEELDEDGLLKYSFYRVAGDLERGIQNRVAFAFWGTTDPDREKEIVKILKRKKGNVQFFPYQENGKSGLPEILDPLAKRMIDEVLSHFHKRSN